MIHAVRDPGTVIVGGKGKRDPGTSDKRLLVVESEFSGALKQFERSGNILSNVMRDAWDGKTALQTLTKTSPTRATDAHVSLIAHTTPEDLRAYLGDTEAANGFGNRFLYVVAERQAPLPNPGRAPKDAVDALVGRVRDTIAAARNIGEMRRTPAAERRWPAIYAELTKDEPGLVGKLLARAEAHVLRLSALYTLLSQSVVIDIEHLDSALALWRHAEACTRLIFGNRTGNKVADTIKHEMLPGESKTLSQIRKDLFSNHVGSGALTDALALLTDTGDVVVERRSTGGRDALVVTRLGPEAHAAGNGAGAQEGAAHTG